MLEAGLERDHITVNTTIYCVIEQQLDNRKFIHEPMTTINRVSREKSISCTHPVVMVTVRAPRTQQPFPSIWLFFFQILLGCVRVGSGVQTDATTPDNVGTCSASWEGYNP